MAEEIKKDVEVEEKEIEVEKEKEVEDKEKEKVTEEDKEKEKVKTFSQEQITKMMTREKNQGRNAVYKELGIDPKDTKAVAMVKALIESQKSEEEKEAEKKSEELTKAQEAEQRALIAEAKAEAMLMGVKTQFVDDAVTLALAKKTEESDLKTLIGELKTKYPIWFGGDEEEDDKSKKGKKGTGSSIKTGEKGNKKGEDKGIGARLAAQRKATTKKSNYWDR